MRSIPPSARFASTSPVTTGEEGVTVHSIFPPPPAGEVVSPVFRANRRGCVNKRKTTARIVEDEDNG
jgi:hypothetical protein